MLRQEGCWWLLLGLDWLLLLLRGQLQVLRMVGAGRRSCSI